MYLALIPVVAIGVMGIGGLLTLAPRRSPTGHAGLDPSSGAVRSRTVGVVASLVIGCALALATARRNTVYRNELVLWTDTAAKSPDNVWAHNGLGVALLHAGRPSDAAAEYAEALRLVPGHPMAEGNLGNLLSLQGDLSGAIAHYKLALKADPNMAEIHYDLADALSRTPGGTADAIAQYEDALRIRPDYVKAHNNLAVILEKMPGREQAAIDHYQQALAIDPAAVDIRSNFANCLNNIGVGEARSGRVADAIGHFKEALRIKPGYANALRNLAIAERSATRGGN
jgi:tetratricopeptide (TPR) repeat protein